MNVKQAEPAPEMFYGYGGGLTRHRRRHA